MKKPLSHQEETLQERRLRILQILRNLGEEVNHRRLQTALNEFYIKAGIDVIRADLAWLADLRLLTVEDLSEDVAVAAITLRGEEVAAGITEVPGIRKPKVWER